MKKFKLIYLMGLLSHIFSKNIYSTDNIITLFIKEAQIHDDYMPDNRPIEIVSEKLMQPSYVFGIPCDASFFESLGISGIPAIYLGYITNSNKDGQIAFPRRHQSDQVYLAITPRIIPAFMIAPTLINHWEIDPSQPLEIYEINRKKDKSLNTYYFDVINMREAIKSFSMDIIRSEADEQTIEKYENILTGKQAIPLNTITLIADPKNIFVPTGISLNTYSTNFVLPNISAIEVNTAENSLYTLSIKQYFEQINIESKNETPNIATIIANQ